NEVGEELDYCRQVVEVVETQSKIAHIPAVKENLNVLKEVIDDYEVQLSYSSDPDARVGHKSADSAFFGFKTHIAMSDGRIITAAIVTTGEKSDGQYLQELVEKSKETRMEIQGATTIFAV
ncbi:transposase, partial [Kurthia sibirica]|uniref:transposase n=1 Tax=Kurthia sibirica TaxID=202750 RepID=UPI0035EB470B